MDPATLGTLGLLVPFTIVLLVNFNKVLPKTDEQRARSRRMDRKKRLSAAGYDYEWRIEMCDDGASHTRKVFFDSNGNRLN